MPPACEIAECLLLTLQDCELFDHEYGLKILILYLLTILNKCWRYANCHTVKLQKTSHWLHCYIILLFWYSFASWMYFLVASFNGAEIPRAYSHFEKGRYLANNTLNSEIHLVTEILSLFISLQGKIDVKCLKLGWYFWTVFLFLFSPADTAAISLTYRIPLAERFSTFN